MVIETFDRIDLSGVKGVLLDLDDTLYAYHPCHEAALKSCGEEFLRLEKYKTKEDFVLLYHNARKKVGQELKGLASCHSRLLYFQNMFEQYYGQTEYMLTLKFDQLYWDTFLTHMHLKTDAIAFLETCKEKNIPICLVTDLTAEIQHRKVNKLNISKYIKFMVSSEEAGAEKPAKMIFNKALEKIGLTPVEVIMIGDSVEKDIEGAKLSGIKAYQIKT
jgi:HAD superfamily hydrolase (TIGR01549 family)